MQIWQIFLVLRQPVTILATVFSNPTKLTNDLFYFVSFRHLDLQLVILDLAKLQDQLWRYTTKKKPRLKENQHTPSPNMQPIKQLRSISTKLLLLLIQISLIRFIPAVQTFSFAMQNKKKVCSLCLKAPSGLAPVSFSKLLRIKIKAILSVRPCPNILACHSLSVVTWS